MSGRSPSKFSSWRASLPLEPYHWAPSLEGKPHWWELFMDSLPTTRLLLSKKPEVRLSLDVRTVYTFDFSQTWTCWMRGCRRGKMLQKVQVLLTGQRLTAKVCPESLVEGPLTRCGNFISISFSRLEVLRVITCQEKLLKPCSEIQKWRQVNIPRWHLVVGGR